LGGKLNGIVVQVAMVRGYGLAGREIAGVQRFHAAGPHAEDRVLIDHL
jgi:hypothetical protein